MPCHFVCIVEYYYIRIVFPNQIHFIFGNFGWNNLLWLCDVEGFLELSHELQSLLCIRYPILHGSDVTWYR